MTASNRNIDPTNLNSVSKEWLLELLQSRAKRYVAATIGRTYRLAFLPCDNGLLNYIVYNEDRILGKGTGYTVYQAEGVLEVDLDNHSILFKRKNNLVYKEPIHSGDDEKIITIKSLTSRLPYLHAKHFDQTKSGIAYTEKHLGQNLQAYYRDHRPNNLLDLINHAINLIRALQVVHNANITHRDIKPLNVMVTPTGKIKVIDFNLAKSGNEIDSGDSCGTAAYLAPESLLGNTQQSDTYSLGMILFTTIFGGVGRIAQPRETQSQALLRYMATWSRGNDVINHGTLFANVAIHIESKYKELIRSAIIGLLTVMPARRKNLDFALEKFLEIKRKLILQRDFPHATPEEKASLKYAMIVGAQTHRELSKIQYRDNVSIENLRTTIFTQLATIDNDSDARNCFIQECGVKAFAEPYSSIEETTNKILNKFKNNVNQLLAAKDTLVVLKRIAQSTGTLGKEAQDLLTTTHSLLRHAAKCNHKLDSFDAYNKKYSENTSDQPVIRIKEVVNRIQELRKKIIPNDEHYANLIKHLASTEPLTNSTPLKNKIRAAIKTYLRETLTLENMRTGSRAASDDRYKAVNQMMSLLNSNSSSAELHAGLKDSISKMKFGLFNWRRGSKLYRLVDDVLYQDTLANTKKSMLGRGR